MKEKKQFIIVGAGFRNTGAVSMLYTTVDALRKKYPDCEIIMFAKAGNSNLDNYRFRVERMSRGAFLHSMHSGIDLRYYFEGLIKLFLRRGDQFKEYERLESLLGDCDGVFDISGYAITSQLKNSNTMLRIIMLELFTRNNIPFYFMPQSFGPFEYKKKQKYIMKRLKELLPKASRIFVREEDGYRMLSELIGGRNVSKSYDMVLQSKTIDKSNIYNTIPVVKEIEVLTEGNVAIIPNIRNNRYGNNDEIYNIYCSIVDCLSTLGKNIYLISHSEEDNAICDRIKERFQDMKSVFQIKEKMDVWCFDNLIKKFDFAIASRYHSIVHSYKAGIPCIALGWAVKYKELLSALGQERFLFDVRNIDSEKKIIDSIMEMNGAFELERDTIKRHLCEIQSTNCFDEIDF